MSDIAPVSNSSLIGAISANEARARKAEQLESTEVALTREADAVEISPFARFVAMARENPVREDLIESIRQQIADGTYDTDDKFDRAFDEMLSDLR
jgi:negative regulator of flagellin synthesis FlgM